MTNRFLSALGRRKTIHDDGSQLARVLTLLDLTGLGVGSTLGLGVYVLAGSVAKTVAGPAVCLSFLIAAVASAVAGLCYAEFAARVPKAGSAYVYSYVSVGEFIAYIIGWNLILEYVIGTASVARGLSGYIDSLADNSIKNYLNETLPIRINFLSPYPDFLAFGFVIILTMILAFGVKESSRFNNIFTALNLVIIAIVLVSGVIKAETANWSIPASDVPSWAGEGGFMPYGLTGVITGAARCFYGFVGFDAVATTGEEAKNPQKNIPLAIVISLVIIFLAYFGISTVLTMMWPYYDQDENAPFPYVFDKIGWTAVKWIVTIGAIFALCTSLLGAMFPLPRILYAMSNDRVIFKQLATVNPRTKTPLIATIISGLLAGVMAIMFDLEQLIDMMSIGTLLAYTIVAVCVLILRYKPSEEVLPPQLELKHEMDVEHSIISFIKLIFNLNNNKYPDAMTSTLTNWSIGLFSIFAAGFCSFFIFASEKLSIHEPHFLTLFIVVTIIMVSFFVIISRQPVDNIKLSFKVPLVPLIPCISVVINLYLMLVLDVNTWIRFVVWLIIGFLIYFSYGIWQSAEGKYQKKTRETETPNDEITKF